jgi:TPR repeat protein
MKSTIRACAAGLLFALSLGVTGAAHAAALSVSGDPRDDAVAAENRGDYAAALAIWRPRAEKGDPWSQFHMGMAYDFGHGVREDKTEAVRWYRLAADQDYSDAEFNLGVALQNGEGVAKDEAEAIKWYRKAAGHGDKSAMTALGSAYGRGRGVPKDQAEALRWTRMAAAESYPMAVANLGVIYYQGYGVPKDPVEAYKYYLIVTRLPVDAENPDVKPHAQEAVDYLESILTTEQIAEGRRRASAWTPQMERR